MTEDTHRNEINKAMFMNLVMMLASSCMQQLGKIINPLSGKAEVSLEGAQASIELIEMLKDKTRGNVDKHEERLLTDTLSTLQMNYVETSQAQPVANKSEATASDAKAGPVTSAGSGTESKPVAEDPKFHKTYG